MEKLILRVFFSELWAVIEKQTLQDKINRHFYNKTIMVQITKTFVDADIAVFKSLQETTSVEGKIPPFLPCIYLMKNPHENPNDWVPSSFLKIPTSIELIGLGIRFQRTHQKE